MRALFALLVILAPVQALADSKMPEARLANTQLADPAKEAQARALMETLRCLVCQGQSIADSDAELAGDMRALVRERIEAGQTPDQVRSWLISRYGDWVSYAPGMTWTGAFLWLLPVILLVFGGMIIRSQFRRRR